MDWNIVKPQFQKIVDNHCWDRNTDPYHEKYVGMEHGGAEIEKDEDEDDEPAKSSEQTAD
jgi:hypothetical protein